jgi:hypothetical protein
LIYAGCVRKLSEFVRFSLLSLVPAGSQFVPGSEQEFKELFRFNLHVCWVRSLALNISQRAGKTKIRPPG